MEIKWEDLPNDGAPYKCSFSTYFAPDLWQCPSKANQALPDTDYNELKKTLPTGISLTGRALCGIHQTMIERDFK